MYQDFFGRSQIVLSAPIHFFWYGENIDEYGGCAIGQAIPRRHLIGLEFGSGAIEFGSHKVYNPKRDRFEYSHLNYINDSLLGFLTSHFGQRVQAKIHLLSELPPEEGPLNRGAVCSSLAVAFLLKSGEIAPDQIKRWSASPVHQLLADPTLGFLTTFKLSWRLELELTDYYATGAQSFFAMLGGTKPLVFVKNSRQADRVFEPLTSDFSSDQYLDHSIAAGFRISDAFEADKLIKNSWPLDFALVFTGLPQVVSLAKSKRQRLKEFKLVQARIKKLEPLIEPVVFDQLVSQSYYHDFQRSISVGSLEMIIHLIDLFSDRASESVVERVIRSVNTFHHLIYPLEVVPDRQYEFIADLRRALNDPAGTTIGIKTNSAGSGGSLLVVSAYGSGPRLERAIDQLKSDWPEISLNYASWQDNFENTGVVLEQDVQSRNYSDFIAAGSVVVTRYDQFKSKRLIFSQNQWGRQQASLPIVLDRVESNIFFTGTRLSSKVIPSQKATVAILTSVLVLGKPVVAAAELPDSIYSRDRNELQSKILSPFALMLEHHLGLKMPFKVRGGIVDFVIEFEPPESAIWVVENIL